MMAKNFLLTEPWPLNAITIIKFFDLHTINVLIALAPNYSCFLLFFFFNERFEIGQLYLRVIVGQICKNYAHQALNKVKRTSACSPKRKENCSWIRYQLELVSGDRWRNRVEIFTTSLYFRHESYSRPTIHPTVTICILKNLPESPPRGGFVSSSVLPTV